METKSDLLAELDRIGVEQFTATDYRRGRVLHLVLFAFGVEVTDAQKAEAAERFEALAASARIRSIESGAQLSGEVDPGGFELAFVVTFDSLGDRNFYVGEPIVTDPAFFDAAHADFKSFVGPLLRSVEVFDFMP